MNCHNLVTTGGEHLLYICEINPHIPFT